MCFTQKWLADSLFRVMPRPQWHWRVKLIAVGQDGKSHDGAEYGLVGSSRITQLPRLLLSLLTHRQNFGIKSCFFVNTGISPWQTMIFSSTSLGWWFSRTRIGQHAAIHWDFWMDDPHQWRDATSGCWMIGHGQPYVHVTSSNHGWLVESGCLELARCFSSRSKLDSPWCSHGAYYYLQYVFLLSARTCFFSDHNFGESTAGYWSFIRSVLIGKT